MSPEQQRIELAVLRLRAAVNGEDYDIEFMGGTPFDDVQILLVEYDRLTARSSGVAQAWPIRGAMPCRDTARTDAVECNPFADEPPDSPTAAPPAGEAWTADQFWQFAEGLTDAHVRDQLRDMLAERGLSISSTDSGSAAK